MEVKDLPEAALKAFEKEGIDISSVICTDKTGKMHMMKNTDVHVKDTKFPIATTEIQGMSSVSSVLYKGSNCCTYIINGNSVTFCW